MTAQRPQSGRHHGGHVVRTVENRHSVVRRAAIWFHFGGWCDDGDTYETQEYDFEQQLNRFWADVVGPDEHLRLDILSSLAPIKPAWKSVTISSDGTVTIRHTNGSRKAIKPSRRS